MPVDASKQKRPVWVVAQRIDTANGAVTVTAGGAVVATDVTSLTDNDANDISIATTVGNITAGIVNAGATAGDVVLNSAAAITDGAGKITAQVVTAVWLVTMLLPVLSSNMSL